MEKIYYCFKHFQENVQFKKLLWENKHRFDYILLQISFPIFFHMTYNFLQKNIFSLKSTHVK